VSKDGVPGPTHLAVNADQQMRPRRGGQAKASTGQSGARQGQATQYEEGDP
jgi:hypothetical protein